MLKKSKLTLGLGVVMCVVLQLFSVKVFAQSAVEGKITDENGATLPGATVTIKGTYRGVTANANGDYRFTNLKNGTYRFVVSFLGYQKKEKQVELKTSTKLNFQLKSENILADEVIVAATRVGNKTPIAATDLNKASVQQQNTGQDIPYQLSLTPSVVSSSEAGAGVGNTSLRIRGTDASRINITMNGIPLNDAESQGVYWVNMPDFGSSVDNIQIQRGVGTSTNGAAAFGATINFQTETLNKDAYAEIQSVGGSFNTFRNTFKVGTGLINGKFSFDARYSRLKSDGFVDRAFSDHESFFMTGSYYTEKSILKLNILSGKQKTGISWWGNDDMEGKGRRYNPAGKYKDENGNTHFYKNQTDNYKQTHYQLFYSRELNNYVNLNTAIHYTKGRGYYEQYKRDIKHSSYGLPDIIVGKDTITTDLIRQKKMSNDFYGFTASLNYYQNMVRASLGGAWNRYDGDHFGEVKWAKKGNFPHDYQWYFNNGKKTDYNVFAKINLELNNKLNVFGDVQYRHIGYETTGNDDDLRPFIQNHKFDFFNPKAGLFYTFNDKNNAYASFGVAHREPTRANFKDAKDNPELLPTAETLFDYELGYNYKGTKATLGFNVYYMNYKDQLVPTGELSSVGYPIMTNVKKSYRAGIELVGGIQILPSLKWDANITLSRNKIKNFVDHIGEMDKNYNLTGKIARIDHLGTTDISYSPNVIGSSQITWNPLKNFTTAFTTKYVGKQYIDNTSNNSRQMDAYCVSNLRLQYNIQPKWVKQIGLSLQINNLFDTEYENNAYGSHSIMKGKNKVSNWIAYFPQTGINFLAGITVKF